LCGVTHRCHISIARRAEGYKTEINEIVKAGMVHVSGYIKSLRIKMMDDARHQCACKTNQHIRIEFAEQQP